jgi:hypothetical protein
MVNFSTKLLLKPMIKLIVLFSVKPNIKCSSQISLSAQAFGNKSFFGSFL